MKQTMVENIKDLIQFLSRPDVPVLQIVKLLGRQRPTSMFGGHVVNPHDKRFKSIVIRTDQRNARILKSITFHSPEHPLSMSDLIPMVGDFKAKYKRKLGETEFIAAGFGEESIIENFTTKMENYRFVNLREGGFRLVMPDETRHEVDTADIFIDHFTFNFIEREPPAESEVKPPRA